MICMVCEQLQEMADVEGSGEQDLGNQIYGKTISNNLLGLVYLVTKMYFSLLHQLPPFLAPSAPVLWESLLHNASVRVFHVLLCQCNLFLIPMGIFCTF